MNRLRRFLLELWLLLPVGLVVGFLGPFGTYLHGDFLTRTVQWWSLLFGAYIVVRPALFFWAWIARATRLPRGTVMLWGISVSSVPMALLWALWARPELKLLGGYAGILPFSFLCALLILLIAGWAARADDFLLRYYREPPLPGALAFEGGVLPETVAANGERAAVLAPPPSVAEAARRDGDAPRLADRLGPAFGGGDVLALESEDHYVRVHGTRGSELLLMRLRDAIAEMDDIAGEQTHRSWWVARDAVADVRRAGRNIEIVLTNGERAPVARDSVDRLQGNGFLPVRSGGE